MEKETEKILKNAGKLSEFSQSENWVAARKKLSEKIAEARDVLNLPDNYSKEDVEARRKAVEIIREWIADIDDSSEAHKELIRNLEGE